MRAQMKIVEDLWNAVSRSDKRMAMQQKTIEGLELTATLSSFRVLIYSTCMISLSCTNSIPCEPSPMATCDSFPAMSLDRTGKELGYENP